MDTALSEEIRAFEQLLPKLRQDCGSAWIVMVDKVLKASFSEFQQAAKFAIDKFPDRQFLIRHTDQQQVDLPFVSVHD